jgi:hypothetical protein
MKARGLAIQAEQVQMLSGLQTQRYTVALLVRNSADCVNRLGNILKSFRLEIGVSAYLPILIGCSLFHRTFMYHIFLPHTPVPYRSGEPGPPRLEERV